jgi:hypothetical protein
MAISTGELKVSASLVSAFDLFLSLTPAERADAIRVFRLIRRRVPKPGTGPLVFPLPPLAAGAD